MGPNGSKKHEITMGLADYFGWKYISVGDILRKEQQKKSDDGNRISECFKNFKLGKSLKPRNRFGS